MDVGVDDVAGVLTVVVLLSFPDVEFDELSFLTRTSVVVLEFRRG